MNPLRMLNHPGPDTRLAVRGVLLFMSDAFLAIASENSVTCSEEATRGAGLMLSVCADALRERDDEVSS